MSIEIQTLNVLEPADLIRLASGYSSSHKYSVDYAESRDHVSFELRLEMLGQPYIRQHRFDDRDIQECQRILTLGYSVGAFSDSSLVGVILAEPQMWNQSMWVREFHIAQTHRRQGIGTRLMETVEIGRAHV